MRDKLEEETKKLIFSNILNNVPISSICKNFQKTDREIEMIFNFIVARIKSFWFEQRTKDNVKKLMPYVPCDNYADARDNRILLMQILNKIDLSELKFKVYHAELNSQTLKNLGGN